MPLIIRLQYFIAFFRVAIEMCGQYVCSGVAAKKNYLVLSVYESVSASIYASEYRKEVSDALIRTISSKAFKIMHFRVALRRLTGGEQECRVVS